MTHSILPPSSAGIWGKPDGCTGWVLMSQMYPETEDNEEALEGEASHEIGAELINYMSRGVNSTTVEEYFGELADNGVVFTEEMFEGAKIYADDVRKVMRDTGVFGGDNFGTESKVHANYINDLSFGTTDQYIYHDMMVDGFVNLYVWDYKFGYGIVEAFENLQGTNYVQGIIEKIHSIKNWDPSVVKIHIRIVQPRAHHRDGIIREWVITLDKLQHYINQLRDNATIALGNDSVIRSGPHCHYCQARHACPSALQAGLGLFEVAMKTMPMELSPEALGVQLAIVKRAIKQLEYLESGFEEQVKSLVKKGTLVPNFMVEMGYGRVAWSEPAAKIIELGNENGYVLQKPIEVITPTQAKKLGLSTAIVDEVSTKPRSGLKVVPDDGSKARKIFSN